METKVEKVETQVKANEQVAKKRRGRPRKIVQNVDETPVQKKENIEVKPVVKAKEESISKVRKSGKNRNCRTSKSSSCFSKSYQ